MKIDNQVQVAHNVFIGAQTAGRIEAFYTTDEANAAAARVEAIGGELKAAEEELALAVAEDKTAVQQRIDALNEEKAAKRMEYLRNIEWKPLWGIPAGFAAVIMLIFAALFHDKGNGDDEGSGGKGEAEKGQHFGDG